MRPHASLRATAWAIFVVLILAAPGSNLSAGVNQWTSQGPSAGWIGGIAVDPANPDHLLIGTDFGGVHRSLDRGLTWFPIESLENAFSVAFHPTDSRTILAGGSGVFRSTDAGVTWTHVSGGWDTAYFLAIDRQHPNSMYAAGHGGITKSTDGGATFQPLASAPADLVYPLVIDPAQGSILYAGTWDGLLKTTDSGGTWAPVTISADDHSIASIAVDPKNHNTVYVGTQLSVWKSTDAGAHWTRIAPSQEWLSFYGLAIHGQQSAILYAGGGDQLFRTTNGGTSWQRMTSPVPGYNVQRLALDPANPNRVYAGLSEGGFHLSTDGGQTWSLRGPLASKSRALKRHPTQPQTIYSAADDGLYKTTDGGSTWTAQLRKFLLTLDLDPASPNTIYAGGNGVYKSTSGGNSWVKLEGGLPPDWEYTRVIVVDPKNGQRVYAATDEGFFKSTNAGQTWTESTQGLTTKRDSNLVIDPVNPSILYLGTWDAGLFKSTDSGASWKPANTGFTGNEVTALALNSSDPSRLYVCLWLDGIYRSTDAGAHWSHTSDVTVWSLAVDLSDPAVGYAGGMNGDLFVTRNGGQTWQFLDPLMPFPGDVTTLLVPPQPGKPIYAGIYGGSVVSLTQSTLANVFYFPQVGDGRVGDMKLKTSFALANTGSATDVNIEFFRSNGQPLPVTLGTLGNGSLFTLSLEKGESVSLETPGTGELRVGYARISAGPGVNGTAVFTFWQSNVILYEAGVPSTVGRNSLSFFMDSSGTARETGLALVNTATTPADVTLRLYDKAFTKKAEKKLSDLIPFLGPGQHLARYAWEIFPQIANGQVSEGVITLESDQSIAAVTLRQYAEPGKNFPEQVSTMSAFPVIPGRADGTMPATEPTIFYFAQVGDGISGKAKLRTSFVFVNTNQDAHALLEFFGQTGAPMTLNLGSYGRVSSLDLSLLKGTAVSLATAGTDPLQAGYAKVTTTTGVGGTAVFAYSEDGMTFFETGVPASSTSTDFTILLDATGQARDTGLAMVNPGAAAAAVTLRLYDRNFNLRGTKTLATGTGVKFAAGAHLARYATELFAEVRNGQVEEGVITVGSDQPLAAVTLREHRAPLLAFPQDVYVLAAFPSLLGRADK